MPEPALRTLPRRAGDGPLAELLLSFDEITHAATQAPTHHRPIYVCQWAGEIHAIANSHLLAFGPNESPMAHPRARKVSLVGELALVDKCDDLEPQGHTTPEAQSVFRPSRKRTMQASGDDLAIPLRPSLVILPQRPHRTRRRVCDEVMFCRPHHVIAFRGGAQLDRIHMTTHLSGSTHRQWIL